jgi:hypothetical protein
VNSSEEIYVSLEKTGSKALSYQVSRTNNWLTNNDINLNIALKDLCIIVKENLRVHTGDCSTARRFLCEDNVQRQFAPTDIKAW